MVGGGGGRGTQLENSCTKHAVTNRLPVAATLGRVNEASHWNLLTKAESNELLSTANVSLEGNERRQLLGIKTKFRKITGGGGGEKMLFMTCVCT
jgi:hypothetical protein